MQGVRAEKKSGWKGRCRKRRELTLCKAAVLDFRAWDAAAVVTL